MFYFIMMVVLNINFLSVLVNFGKYWLLWWNKYIYCYFELILIDEFWIFFNIFFNIVYDKVEKKIS